MCRCSGEEEEGEETCTCKLKEEVEETCSGTVEAGSEPVEVVVETCSGRASWAEKELVVVVTCTCKLEEVAAETCSGRAS